MRPCCNLDSPSLLPAAQGKYICVDPLLDHHKAKVGLVVIPDVAEGIAELVGLVLGQDGELAVAQGVPEN